MTILDLQKRLATLGFYRGAIDGIYGNGSRDALLACLKAGPDTSMQPADIAKAAALLNVTQAHVLTVRDVEANGAGFANGLPKVLFEGHIFSRLTGHKFDGSHPHLSYPHWDRTKYPKTQEARYQQIVDAVGLDPDAAFESASYGAFQILGENFKACGFASAFDFVLAQCQSEGAQLLAFVNFLKANHLDAALRDCRWSDFARGYNGPAYKQNSYDVKLAHAYDKEFLAAKAAAATTPAAAPTATPAKAPTSAAPAAPQAKLPEVQPAPHTSAQETSVAGTGTFLTALVRVAVWIKDRLTTAGSSYIMEEYVKGTS